MRTFLSFWIWTALSWGSCTLVQHTITPSNCTPGTTTCVLPISSTGASHFIGAALEINGVGSVATVISSVVAKDGGGSVVPMTWVTGGTYSGFVSSHSSDIAWTMSSASGAVELDISRSNTTGAPNYKVAAVEVSCSSPMFVDTGGRFTSSTTSGSHLGVALTTTGVSGFIYQIAVTGPSLSSVTSPYDTNADFSDHFGSSVAITVNGTAPTWTETSPQTGTSSASAIAIKEVAGGSGHCGACDVS